MSWRQSAPFYLVSSTALTESAGEVLVAWQRQVCYVFFMLNALNSRGLKYWTHVGRYSLVSRSTGMNAVYLLWMLQALLVWTA